MRSTHERLERTTAAASLGAFAVVATVTCAACDQRLAAPIPAGAATGHDEPRRGGVLHLATMGDMRTLDPAGPSDALAIEAEHLMFSGLVDYDEEGRVVADLADHYTVEDGGRTYRFVLRTGVVMHDGAELTAADVKRSAERALRPTTPDPNASYFEDIVGYDAYTSGRAQHLDGISVDGRYTVTFRLKEPSATFLPVLAMHTLRPVCASGGDRYSDAWTPCGAGPFKLPPGGWQRGVSLRLVRHEGYFRAGAPYLDAVEWTFGVTPMAQRFRFEGGALDVLRDMSQPDQARFAVDRRWRGLAITEPDRSVFGESMNTRMAPFDNVEIRRAVAAAVNREHYKALKPAYMTILTQALPPASPGYDPALRGQTYDYAAALEHMRKAGYPYDPATGAGGWPAPIVYPVYDQGLLVYTAQLLAQDLAKIGLHLEIRVVSWPAFLALQERPDGAAISQANWEMDFADPSSVIDPLFTSPSLRGESTYNTAFFADARVDELAARARREADPTVRRALYRRADEILCDEAPWAFAYSYHSYDVHQPYVRGLRAHAVWSLDLLHVWMDRATDALSRVLLRPGP